MVLSLYELQSSNLPKSNHISLSACDKNSTNKLDCLLIGKLLIIGDSGTGKTSLFNKFIGNGFCDHTPSTIGIDFHSIEIKIDHNRLSTKLSSKLEKVVADLDTLTKNKTNLAKETILKSVKSSPNTDIRLQLWDAAGQEKFRNIVRAYYRNASVVLLVFDLYNRASFEHLVAWTEQVLNSHKWQHELPLFFLIGNKNDLDRTHLVKLINQNEIDSFCDRYKITSYYSISAKLDEDLIKTILIDIAHELYFHTEFIRELQTIRDDPSNSRLILNGNSQYSESQLVRQAACCLLL